MIFHWRRESPCVRGRSASRCTGPDAPAIRGSKNREPVHGGNRFKFLEATPYQRHIFDKTTSRLIPFDEAQSSPAVVRDADSAAAPPRSGRAGAQQEAALLLSQIRFFNEFPVPSWVRVLLANMAFYPGFDVTRSSAPHQGRRYQTGYYIIIQWATTWGPCCTKY